MPDSYFLEGASDCKRFKAIPEVYTECTSCGEELPLFRDYISYPVFGDYEDNGSAYCHECDLDFPFTFKLKAFIEIEWTDESESD